MDALRATVFGLGLVGLMVLALVGCGTARQETTTVGSPEVTKPAGDSRLSPGVGKREDAGRKGGSLKMYSSQSWGNPNDPHLYANAIGRIHAMPVTNGLVARDFFDSKLTIVPELAEKWDVSSDGLKYSFSLRKGIKFQNVPPVDGREFTSEDAKWNLLRLIGDESIVPDKIRPRFQRTADFGEIERIDTPDKYTVVVILKQPYAPFMDAISHHGTLMMPKEFVDQFPDKLVLEGMIGTGAYIPTEFRNQQIASYKKNPDYWRKDSKGNQLPYLDEASFLYFADTQNAVASFRARQLDMTTANKEQWESVTKDDPSAKYLVSTKSSLQNFRFNMKFKPFQDERVRRAIHLTLDRQQFVDLISQGLGVPAGPITPAFPELANTMEWLLSQPGYRKDKKADIEEAKRLMREAGYPDGFEVKGMFSTGSTSGDVAALLNDQMKPLSIKLSVEQVDYAGQWLPRSTRGEFELSNMGHVYSVDADSHLTPHFASDGNRNYGKFTDPKLDQLIKQQRNATNLEERRKVAQETEAYILEKAPVVFLYANTELLLYQPWVHNVISGPFSGNHHNTVEWAWVEQH